MDKNNHSRKQLSLLQVVIIGIAYMTPMTVFDTFGIVSGVTVGRVPLAYLIALVAVLFTAQSYGRLVKIYPSAGSAYSYTRHIFGRHSGFMVGWSSLLDYLLLPMINSLLAGIYLRSLFPEVPGWISILIFTALVTYLNCCRIKLLANANVLFVGLPVLLMMAFIYMVVHDLTTTAGIHRIMTTAPLFNGQHSVMPLISGAAILCFSYLGFDAVTTLSGETQRPHTLIPKAIFYTALSGGIIFFIAAWFIQLYYPDNSAFKNPTEAMPEIVLYVGGRIFQTLFLVAILFNTFASALASHASAARLLHIMSKDNRFTAPLFGYLDPVTNTPLYCVLFTGLLSLSAIFFNLDTAVSLISFGALVAFSAVNICVIARFAVKEQGLNSERNILRNLISPAAGLASVAFMWVNLDHDAFVLGSVWAVIGLGWVVYSCMSKSATTVSE